MDNVAPGNLDCVVLQALGVTLSAPPEGLPLCPGCQSLILLSAKPEAHLWAVIVW